MTALVRWLFIEGPRYSDQVKGVLLLGTATVSVALGVAFTLFVHWYDQMAKAEAAG